jgi:hypothetical protein
VEEREARVAKNEALFRAVNEQVHDLNETFATVTDTFSIVCECGDAACSEQIRLGKHAYEELRSDPTLFAVVRGHEIAETEDVVEQHGEYDVVRKHPGRSAQLAKDMA